MMAEWLITGGAIVLLLLVSAYFSASETAMTASSGRACTSHARRHPAQVVIALYERKPRMIGALLLGNNAVNIFASALATGLLLSVFGEVGVYYATAAMTLLVLIFAEVLPKTYALGHADRVALCWRRRPDRPSPCWRRSAPWSAGSSERCTPRNHHDCRRPTPTVRGAAASSPCMRAPRPRSARNSSCCAASWTSTTSRFTRS
jgi:hypothetical protein